MDDIQIFFTFIPTSFYCFFPYCLTFKRADIVKDLLLTDQLPDDLTAAFIPIQSDCNDLSLRNCFLSALSVYLTLTFSFIVYHVPSLFLELFSKRPITSQILGMFSLSSRFESRQLP